MRRPCASGPGQMNKRTTLVQIGNGAFPEQEQVLFDALLPLPPAQEPGAGSPFAPG